MVPIILLSSFSLQGPPVLAGRGCCSDHGGISGCEGAKLRCNDGTLSPTCPCSESGQHDATQTVAKNRPKDGRDYHLKPGANIKDLDPRMDAALYETAGLWRNLAGVLPTINHGEDGIHPDKDRTGTDCSTYESCVKTSGSRHYDHLAVDVDTQQLSVQQVKDLKESLKHKLDRRHFWWRVESQGTINEHLHIQYNPQPGEKMPPRKI
jgi:hypothetical protein